jgi:hypothetical protein
MLSVIDFALTAPVVVQKYEVRISAVDAAKDGTSTASAADRTNAPPIPRSLDSGHWREQEPRQHNPSSRTDSNDPPEPSKPALSIDLNADYSPSPSPPHIDPNANSPPSASPPHIDPNANSPPPPPPPPGPESTSPLPTSQAPTDEPDPLNPSSPHGNTYLNPSLYQGQGPTNNPHTLNPGSPSDPRPGPSHDDVGLNFNPQSSSQGFK